MIEAVRGRSYLSDIAIDDIQITQSYCGGGYLTSYLCASPLRDEFYEGRILQAINRAA